MNQTLENKCALVTGGSRGIGAAIVRAVFIATQAAVKHMKDGGRIINIGSTNSERLPFAGGGVYAMSKSALQGLVQGFARDLGPRGITINNVQPGPVNTEMNTDDGEFAAMLKKAGRKKGSVIGSVIKS